MDLIVRKVPSSQESAEHTGGRRTVNRGNTWRKNTDSEDDVEWAGGRPVAKRDPRDWEGAEQFGGGRGAHGRKHAK